MPSSESSIMLNLFEQITRGRKWKYISIVGGYFSNFFMICHFPELPSAKFLLTGQYWNPQIMNSFKQEVRELLVVPRLNKFHATENRISKSQLIESFLSLLLQLLYHKTGLIVDPLHDRIDNLEKELRFLLTILGDSHEHDAEFFQNLLPEIEAIANHAGSIVRYLFFSDDHRVTDRTDEGLAAFLRHTDVLKASLQSSVSIPPAYETPTTSVVDSIFIVYSLVDDLEELLKREDDCIADIKDQVSLLHQELLRIRMVYFYIT